MEKKEKLEMLDCLAQKLGVLPQEAVEYFSAKVVESSSVVRECEVAAGVLPGMYVYADGSISAELITGRQVKAVVGYVEGKTVYAVCLKAKELPWSSDCLEVKAFRDMTDGKKATLRILESAKERGVKAEAAQWCHDYDYDDVVQGEAFLPLASELDKLSANKEAINKSLRALNASELVAWYWSSTDYNHRFAWKINMGSGFLYQEQKITFYNYVRPVIAIQL